MFLSSFSLLLLLFYQILYSNLKYAITHVDVRYNVSNWHAFVHIQRKWASHIIRTEDERIPQNVLNGKFHNTRPVGEPRTRWEDVVRRYTLQILGIRGWRRQAEDREEWRRLSREARVQKGL
jgi:hypothetical protein